jgi:hypothetical protein
MSSDRWFSRVKKQWFVLDKGIHYAPTEIAYKFSCENRIYCGEFGFHGKTTAALNNWGTLMFEQIKAKAPKIRI